MPIARTSSSTGSRVLYKANNSSDATINTPTPSPGNERIIDGNANGSVKGAESNSYFTSRSDRSSSSSPRMKRFPSILSKKDKDSGKRSTSGGSTGGSSINEGKTPVGHTRSVSLASAPSSLPRPASTSTNNPSLPTSTSQPSMPRPATSVATPSSSSPTPSNSNPSTPSGIPQAKRVIPPPGSYGMASPTSSTPPPSANGATTPSRIPALSTSSGRGVPVSAGQFVPNGHAKTQSDVTGANAFGFRGNSIYAPPQQQQQQQNQSTSANNSPTDRKIGQAEVAAASLSHDTPTRSTTPYSAGSGLGMGIPRSTSAASGIPRLRNFSDPTGSAAAGVQQQQQQQPSPQSQHTQQSSSGSNSRPPSREPSGSGQSAGAGARSAVSDGGSRISQSRGPLPTPPAAPTTQSQSSSDSAVPAMWRTSSYEGSTKAYLSTSASMGRNLSGSSTGTQAESVQGKKTYIGLSGLEDLEAKYRIRAAEEGGQSNAEDATKHGREDLPVEHRLRLLRKLVDLRGQRVLDGQDIERIVWLEGTNLHMTTDEELAMARNGSIVTNATTSPVPGNPTNSPVAPVLLGSPIQPVKSAESIPAVPAQPAKEKKQGLFQKMAASFGGGSSHDKGHVRKSSGGAASIRSEGDQSATLPKSGSAGQLASAPVASSMSQSASQQQPSLPQQAPPKMPSLAKNRGPIFGVKISEAPPLAYAVSIIGGQRHQLPILVFSLVEAIFRRGIDTSGIFRMNGDAAAIARLVETYNTYPTYGDDINLEKETIFTLCDLLKRYLKDMPEPVLSKELWSLFVNGCLLRTDADEEKEHIRKLAAAQIIFRLLPRKNMSLLIYLTAFLFQLPLHHSNRLTIESISVIFGPAVMAPRTSMESSQMGTTMERNTRRSQEGLKWLLDNWDDSLSQDLLDEEYDPLASPQLASGTWSGDATDEEEAGTAEASTDSSEAPKIQYSPQKMTIVQDPMNSPAFSMAATPMMHNFSEQSNITAASGDRSPVPEGWGEAISHSEDNATLQKQLQSSRARRSSFNLDPEISSPTKSEFGNVQSERDSVSGLPETEVNGQAVDMAYAPVHKVVEEDEPQDGDARMSPVVEAEESPTEKPKSLRSVKSSRSLKSLRADGARSPEEQAPLPGAMPMYSPLPPNDPVAERTPRPPASRELQSTRQPTSGPDVNEAHAARLERVEPSTVTGASTARESSPDTTISDAESTHKRTSSSLATSVRDSQTPRSYPLHGRKESLMSEEGRSNSTFGGFRNNSYGGRPTSYARSEATSEMGSNYIPEEINSDPNAARLFGSLGELFMNEKRKVADHQQQLRQLEARQAEHDETVAGLHRDLQDHERRARETELEVQTLRGTAKEHDEVMSSMYGRRAEMESLLTSLQKQLQQAEAQHASKLAEVQEVRNSERNVFLAEISSMRHQLEASLKERDSSRSQLESIRSVLNLAAR